MFIYKK